MRCNLVGMGAAFAALVSVSGVASAQDTTQTFNQNNNSTSYERSESYQRIDNRGIPHQAPALGLGNIYGLNPCATGVSVGVTTPLVGVGGAFSTIDNECQLRNNAAITVSALKDEAAAREIMCEVEAFRNAARRTGRPCIVDGGVALALRAGSNADTASSSSLAPLPPTNRGLPPDVLPPFVEQPAAAPQNGSARQLVPGVNQLPALCHTPGLVLRLYPECSGNPAERHSNVPSNRQPTASQASEPTHRRAVRPATTETSDPNRRIERSSNRGGAVIDSAALAERFLQAERQATTSRLNASGAALRHLALNAMQ